jgi:hypothetical protein
MRKLLVALLFALSVVPAAAQTCDPVPALPDVERITTYTLTAQTGPFSVGFQLYGDSTDYQNWLQVYLNGALQDPSSYTITSPSGSLSTLCRPITNAQITFNTATTGTVVIDGDRRPRRASQFAENRGITARDHNRVLSDIVATQREQWDRMARALQVSPGDSIGVIPSATTRGNSGAGTVLGFNAAGALALYNAGTGGGTIIAPGIDLSTGSILGDGSQHLTVAPTANGISTLSSISVQGSSISTTKREFLANFGLTNTATSGSAGEDKVALYAGIISNPGSAIAQGQWSLNTVNTLSAGTGSNANYNALGYELDFNNLDAHRGDTLLGPGLSAPVAFGLEISGASTFRSTSAVIVLGSGNAIFGDGVANGTTTFTSATANFQTTDVGKSIIIPGSGAAGARLVTTIAARASTTSITLANATSDSASGKVFYVGTAQWNRGITIANNSVQQVSFQDISVSEKSIEILSSHAYGIDMGAASFSTGAIRIPNNSPIIAQSSGGAGVNVLLLDTSNVFQVGGGDAVNVSSVTQATTTSDGALRVAGGVSVAKDIVIGGNLIFTSGWTTFTPSPACQTAGDAAFTVNSARKSVIGKTTFFEVDITLGANTTGTGTLNFSLPSTATSAATFVGRNITDSISVATNVTASGQIVGLAKYDGSATCTSLANKRYVMSGSYESP